MRLSVHPGDTKHKSTAKEKGADANERPILNALGDEDDGEKPNKENGRNNGINDGVLQLTILIPSLQREEGNEMEERRKKKKRRTFVTGVTMVSRQIWLNCTTNCIMMTESNVKEVSKGLYLPRPKHRASETR